MVYSQSVTVDPITDRVSSVIYKQLPYLLRTGVNRGDVVYDLLTSVITEMSMTPFTYMCNSSKGGVPET